MEMPAAKPHIVMYIGSLNRGGAERVMVNLAEYLYDAGWKVTFVTTYVYPDEYTVRNAAWKVVTEPGELGEHGALNPLEEQEMTRFYPAGSSDGNPAQAVQGTVQVQGCCGNETDEAEAARRGICRVLSGLTEAETTSGRIRNVFRRTKKLTRTFRELRPDVVLSFLGKNNIMALQCGGIARIPVVVSVRSNPAREYKEGRLYRQMRRLFPKAAAVVLQTNEAVRFFPENVQRRSIVLPNSVNSAFLENNDRDGQQVRHTIISVGRLDKNKNQGMLIRAYASVHEWHPDWSLVLYGDGPAMEEDQALAERLGVGASVTFTGSVNNIRERIAQDGIFALTSVQEGMPNALLEAMALGLPCVSTDCKGGGPRDIIRNGENGILIPIDDEAALTAALLDLIENPARAEGLGRAAMQDMKALAPAIVNRRWEECLLAAIQSKR